MTESQAFIQKMLNLAQSKKVAVQRGEPCRGSKGSYHIVIQDPETSRAIIALGTEDWGDDYSWGQEINPSEISSYL